LFKYIFPVLACTGGLFRIEVQINLSRVERNVEGHEAAAQDSPPSGKKSNGKGKKRGQQGEKGKGT